jgi:hypothetical protein
MSQWLNDSISFREKPVITNRGAKSPQFSFDDRKGIRPVILNIVWTGMDFPGYPEMDFSIFGQDAGRLVPETPPRRPDFPLYSRIEMLITAIYLS